MVDSNTKKEYKALYRERETIGGVYLIRNTVNNRVLLDAATDLNSRRNRFEFSQKTGSCVEMKLQRDWVAQETSDFVFEVLEELKKSDTQTPAEFKADIEFLKEIWLDKLAGEEFQ